MAEWTCWLADLRTNAIQLQKVPIDKAHKDTFSAWRKL